MPDEPELIPLSQAVTRYKLSRASFYVHIKTGELARYRKVGEKRTLLDTREIEKLLEPRKVKPQRKAKRKTKSTGNVKG